MTKETEEAPGTPGLFRNYISLIGAALALVSLASIIFLFLIEMFGGHGNPYLGIITYLIVPAFLILGLVLIPVGMLIERRRRRKLDPSEIAAYPAIDLNDPRHRRRFAFFVTSTLILILMSGVGSYRAYEYSDSVAFCGELCHSVMKPEMIAYQASPHARVKCVDCHVGPGAGWYVRSKLSGAYQVYATLLEKYPKPIPTPVANLRPAQETCEQCHWPEKFFGAQLKIFNHYGYDEQNTLRQIRMLINTGGGSPTTGMVEGIHWHMNIANEITYIASDNQRQVIPWVRMKSRDGQIEEFFAEGAEMSAEDIERATKRRMDCVDCHNRPTHIYVPPDRAVNESLVAGKLDPSLPFLKAQAVEALSQPYTSTDEALRSIASSIDSFYRDNHPEAYSSKGESIKSAIAEVQRIFQTYFFPEMKVDWQTHPDNAGHYYSQGCFRCHDGKHVSKSGKVIRADCNICHTVLDQSEGGTPITITGGSFQHPIDMGDMTGMNCTDCHSGKGNQ
ncbi:MAG TPA: NapC/NirT family cytochrome c [Blastocatellia bacterium]|nr:NapC/NirT family cytochrome c [Blastocatellia bacterium]